MLHWIVHHFTTAPWQENWLPLMTQALLGHCERSFLEDVADNLLNGGVVGMGEVSWDSAGTSMSMACSLPSPGPLTPLAGTCLDSSIWGDRPSLLGLR